MSGWWAFRPGEEDIAGKIWLHGGAGAITGLRKKSRGVSLNWEEGVPQGGRLVIVQGGGTRGCHCPRRWGNCPCAERRRRQGAGGVVTIPGRGAPRGVPALGGFQ